MPAIDQDTLLAWDRRIAGEFGQCPGLRLTAAQAARFWGLDRGTAESLLDALVHRGLLFRSDKGVFVRRGACPQCE